MPTTGPRENPTDRIHRATAEIKRFLALLRCLPEGMTEFEDASHVVLRELAAVGELLAHDRPNGGIIEAYRAVLENLRNELPNVEKMLVAAQLKIVTNRTHLSAAAAWANASKPLLQRAQADKGYPR